MALRSHHYRRRSRDSYELNVTAFLNLMVVLVPFLLITAVFSRIAILQLNLPPGAAADSPDEPELEVEVIIREQMLEIGDGERVIHRMHNDDAGYDFEGLKQILLAIKKSYPDEREATILVEPEIPYDVLVAVMDATREAQVAQLGGVARVELFPQVSIGDAPARGGG